MEKGTATIAAIATALIGLAIVSVIFSNKAQTPQVLQAAGTAFSGVIGAAVSPVTGSSTGGTPSIGNLFGNSTGNYLGSGIPNVL